MQLAATPWLVVPKALEKPTARLVCFPHSGGGPSAFGAWQELLDEAGIEVVAVSAPGRERRVTVPPLVDSHAFVEEVCEALLNSGLVDGPPFAFFGHSLGAVLAYEVAARLEKTLVRGRPRPILLLASGHGAPDLAVASRSSGSSQSTNDDVPWGRLHRLSDQELTAMVQKFGVLSAEVVADPAMLALVLPALRADFQMYETYTPAQDRTPLPLRIVAIGGSEDSVVSPSGLATWRGETTAPFEEPLVFPGGHFFLEERRAEVVRDAVLPSLRAALGALPRSAEPSVLEVPQICHHWTLLQAFWDVAEEHPSQEAAVDEVERVNYADFAARVRKLGEVLHHHYLGGRTDQVVALLTPHNVTYMVGMLGIWAASGKILVIEAHFNKELCKEICEESFTAAAVASPKFAPKFDDVQNCKTLVLEGSSSSWAASLPATGPDLSSPPVMGIRDDAILMMTSGTTGRPKTILGSHFFMHLGVHAKNKHSPYTEDDQREAFNVMFVWEVLRPLVHGLTSFVIPDDATLDTSIFVSCLEKHACSRVLTTPSLLESMIQMNERSFRELRAMRTWYTCGEILPMTTVQKFRSCLPKCRLVNVYSSWEGADVGYGTVSPQPLYEPSKNFAMAGTVAPGTHVVIIDPETKQVVPRGCNGELYCGGPAVSSGYFMKPEATAERFVDPFTDEMRQLWQGKWYKSGDGARFVGEPPVLELSGRIDSTVKIRGFKVGIPVVEQAVREIPGVALCGVVPVYSAPGIVDKLVLFAKPKEDIQFDDLVQTLKREGVKRMPRWMMPTVIKAMPEQAFSQGEARKLDRKKLQAIAQQEDDEVRAARDAADEAQQGAEVVDAAKAGGVRDVLRAVWAKALNLSIRNLDLEENFFDLGGHSMLAAQIAQELSNKHGISVTVLDIYSNSTLGTLMDFVDPDGAKGTGAQELGRPRLPGRGAPSLQAGLAIVGLAGRFPGADDVDEFWANLSTGTVSATFLSKDLLLAKGVPEETVSNKDFVPCAYMINDADKFDHLFFGIGRNEAALMDPQHRVFIETSWSAVENAGINPRSGLSDTVVGVFAATGIDGYLVHHLDGLPLKNTMDPNDIFLAEIGNEKDYIATRVSYLMNFTGPSMNVNAACSSALVAVVQGAAAIASGQCDAALAGGSSITFPNLGYLYMDGLVASVDGYVKPFDKDADGTVFGDSCGAALIRRREDVVNDLEWGILRGFAVSNDGGRKAGYAAPSSAGQAQAIMAAMEMMGESPWSLSYVECHATGTRVGDGIEVRGLIDAMQQVGGKPDGSARVALGSVKGNIAHANCAAGITGLAKLLLMMRSKQLPPTANYKMLNPKIDLGRSAFFVNTELCAWDTGGKVRRAGVSSFGIGGTNAHCVVDEPPETNSRARGVPSGGFQILPFSAKSASALKRSGEQVAKGLRRFGEQPVAAGIILPTLTDAAYTQQTCRAELPLRKALLIKTSDATFAAAADQLETTMPEVEELDEIEDAKKKPAVAFVFPGQGSQYFRMGRGLYDHVPTYRDAADRCCELLLRPDFLGFDIRPVLFESDGGEEKEKGREKEFARPSVLQPCLFVTEYALSQVFLAIGVSPVAVAGHSLGEYTAAVAGGLLDLESACSIVAARAKSVETLAEDGSMLSVADWSQEELDVVSRGLYKGLWVAAVNSPVHAVISGETAAIDKLEKDLKEAGKKCGKLQVRKAFHSGLVQKAADTLKGLGVPKEGTVATIPVASNKTGGWLTAEMLRDGTYWTDHMRGAVLWRDNAVKLLAEYQPVVVLECGPMNALSTLTKKCVPADVDVPSFLQGMRHPKATGTSDLEALLTAIGQLWERGCDIDWMEVQTKVLGARAAPATMRLPGYGFERISLWANPERSVYVDSTPDPAPILYANLAAAAQAGQAQGLIANGVAHRSPVGLVRFAGREGQEPSIRAYCLPFASGSARLFAPWSDQVDDAVEIVAIELPGRGGRSDELMPANDAEDLQLLDAIVDAIISDARGTPYVLVGFSMGGGLCAQLALMFASKGAQEPVALYIAGRKPPATNPGDVGEINMSNEELAEYAFAPAEVANSPEFIEHVVPLLRSDLELDARTEKRLSNAYLAGQRFSPTMGVQIFCGTSDDIAPFAAAPDWQRFSESPIGLHYFPGGHEFMQEQRPLIFSAWRRDAIGRLLQRRTAELALLSAQGFSAPGSRVSTLVKASSAVSQKDEKLPFYAVKWVPAVKQEFSHKGIDAFVVDLTAQQLPYTDAVTALQKGSTIMILSRPTQGVLSGQTLDAEVGPCWRFVQLVQQFLDAGLSGHIVVVCAAAVSGALVSGASKAIALEAAELRIQRVFVPPALLKKEPSELTSRVSSLVEKYPDESDLWLQARGASGSVYTPRIESVVEPSSKLECIAQKDEDGNLATYVLTGATGGLGSALVEWLTGDQKISPEQLVLVRRAGSRSLSGILAKCRTVEVTKVDSEEALFEGLKGVKNVVGIFHLAGVLDDGIVQGMTEDRFLKVAQPKCGMLTALLRTACKLAWPLAWTLGFSSTSSLFGYAGQSNYCAANAMLDHMATFASASGVPEEDQPPCRFIAVNWGPWGEAGMAQVGTKAYEQAVKEGDTPLKTKTALRCLAAALRNAQQAQAATMQYCACDVAWQKSTWADLPILGLVHERERTEEPNVLSGSTVNASSSSVEASTSRVQSFMVEHTKGGSWKRVQGKSLHQLGLDSLEVVQIRNAFNKAFGTNVPLAAFADVSQTVGDIVVQLGKEAPAAAGAASPAPGAQPGAGLGSKLQAFMVEHTKGGSWKRIEGKSFHQLGLDSLEVVQLRNAYNKAFGTNVPLATFADVSQKVGDIVTLLGNRESS